MAIAFVHQYLALQPRTPAGHLIDADGPGTVEGGA